MPDINNDPLEDTTNENAFKKWSMRSYFIINNITVNNNISEGINMRLLKMVTNTVLALIAFNALSAPTQIDNRQLNIIIYNQEHKPKIKNAIANKRIQKVTLNKKSSQRATQSKEVLTSKDLVVIGQDQHGKELSRQIVKNPLYFRAEIFDEHSGDISFSKDIKRDSALLNIVVPDNGKLHSIAVFEALEQKNKIINLLLGDFYLTKDMQKSFESLSSAGVFKVMDNGESNNRADLVFLSEGYTESELSQFSTDVDNIIKGYFDVSPYLEYKKLYNVWRVETASIVSGAGNGSPINTKFGAHFGCYGIERLLCVDETKVINYINSVMDSTQADQVVVVVNTQTYGGAGGTVATISLAPAAINLALHEVGHSFGHLADEYTNGTCITSEPTEANATTNSYGSKWSHWQHASNVSAYQGGRYCTSGMYRPTYDSMMNHLGVPFYQVNEEELIKRTYHFVDPIDSVYPITSSINIGAEQSQTFTVQTVSPVPNSININWYIDNERKGSGNEFTLAANDFSNGTHTLLVQVKDNTDKVIKDEYNVTQDSHSWQLIIGGACTQIQAPNGLVSSDITSNSLTITWGEVSNVSAYQVQILEGGTWYTKQTVTQNIAHLTNFSPSQNIDIRIIAIGNCGQSLPSETLNITLKPDMGTCSSVPSVPTGLTADIYSEYYFRVSWNDTVGASSYSLQKWIGTWEYLATTTTNSSDWLYLTGIQYIRVNSTNDCGSSDYSSHIKVR